MDELKSRRMDNFADGRQEQGLEGLRSQGDVKRNRLEERRREAARYRDAYLYFLNRQRLEEQRSKEGLTDDQRKRWQIEKDYVDPSKQQQIEQDHIGDQSKQSQFREDLTRIEQQRIGEYLARMRLRQGESLFTKRMEQLIQKDVLGRVLNENKDKLFTKNNHEGTNDGQENADSATSKTPPHIKNPNPSDPSFDGINTKQQDSTASKDHVSSPDSKTYTSEGTNPQWHVDQATSYKQGEFIHSKLDDSKSTEADATKHSDMHEHSKQKSGAEAKFTSADDLYKNVEAIEVIRVFFESKEGKIMLEREYNFARTQKEFLDSGAARVNSEKVGIDNPQKIMKSMQIEIDEYRLRLANVIDPKLVQLGEVQKEEYYRCLKDLDRCLTTANNYMRNMIDVAKSKTKFSSNTPQRSTPPLVHAVA